MDFNFRAIKIRIIYGSNQDLVFSTIRSHKIEVTLPLSLHVLIIFCVVIQFTSAETF